MKKFLLLTILFFEITTIQKVSSQFNVDRYKVDAESATSVLIENGKLYRITIKSCWYSAYARIGTYLIYGLNVADPKTGGMPCILKIAETDRIDWTFSFRRSGQYDAKLIIGSRGWGDQGLMVIVEKLSGY